MTMQWLEPAIKNRIYEITVDSSKDHSMKVTHDNFMRVLLKLHDIDSAEGIAFELEELFNNNSIYAIEYSYRIACVDMLPMVKPHKTLPTLPTFCPHEP